MNELKLNKLTEKLINDLEPYTDQLSKKYKNLHIDIDKKYGFNEYNLYGLVISFMSLERYNVDDLFGIDFSISFVNQVKEKKIHAGSDIIYSDGTFFVDEYIEEFYSVDDFTDEVALDFVERSIDLFKKYFNDIEKGLVEEFL